MSGHVFKVKHSPKCFDDLDKREGVHWEQTVKRNIVNLMQST